MSTIIVGDVSEGSKWWSLADFQKRELARLYKQNNAFMQTWKPVNASVKIHCIMRAGTPVAFIYSGGGDVYMESGFLFHHSTVWANEFSHIPSRIRFNDFVAQRTPEGSAMDTQLVNPSKAKSIADGDESLAIGCEKKVDTLTEYDLFGDEYAFTSSEPIFCPNLRGLKKAQVNCPPSAFTGKMRLFLQAVYGSKRTDYYYDEFRAPDYPHLVFSGEKATVGVSSGPNTTGIYKDPHGEYWLIKMEYSSVTARKMTAKPGIEGLIANMHDSLKEAYVLAGLTMSDEEKIIGQANLIDGYSAVAYGWKFNSTGEKISIVGYREAEDILGSSGIGNGLNTRVITVTLAYDEDAKTPVMRDQEVIEEGNYVPFIQSRVFTPNYFLSMMVCLTIPGPVSSTDMVNFAAPIYCYYDKDDNLKIFRAHNGSWTSNTKDTYDYSGNIGINSAGHTFTNDVNPLFSTVIGTKVSIAPSGFSVSDFTGDFLGTTTSYANAEFTASWVYLSDEAVSGVDGNETHPRIRYKYPLASEGVTPASYCQDRVGSAYKSSTAILIIPFGDAESVVLAQENSGGYTPTETTQFRLSQNSFWKQDLFEWRKEDTEIIWLNYANSTFPLTTGPYLNYNVYQNLAGTQYGVENPALANAGVHNHKTQTASIFRSASNIPEVIYSASSGNPDSALGFTTMLQVSQVNPVFDYLIGVTAGYSSGLKWDLPATSGSSNWPESPYTDDFLALSTPVGWA